jgi:hypothetical protein
MTGEAHGAGQISLSLFSISNSWQLCFLCPAGPTPGLRRCSMHTVRRRHKTPGLSSGCRASSCGVVALSWRVIQPGVPCACRFLFDGQRVNPHQTPSEVSCCDAVYLGVRTQSQFCLPLCVNAH